MIKVIYLLIVWVLCYKDSICFIRTEVQMYEEYNKIRNFVDNTDLEFTLMQTLSKMPLDLKAFFTQNAAAFFMNQKRLQRMLALMDQHEKFNNFVAGENSTTTLTTPTGSGQAHKNSTSTATETHIGNTSTMVPPTGSVLPTHQNTTTTAKQTPIENTSTMPTGTVPVQQNATTTQTAATSINSMCLGQTVMFVTDLSLSIASIAEAIMNNNTAILGKLLQDTPWTFTALDSMGKLGPGALQGNFHFVGSKRECEEINTNNPDFVMKYAYAVIKMPGFDPKQGHTCPRSMNDLLFSFTPLLSVAVCLPNSCSNKESTQLFNFALELLGQTSSSISCGVIAYEREIPWTTGAIVMLFFLSTIGALVVLGTLVDYFFHQPALDKMTNQSAQSDNQINRYQNLTLEDYHNDMGSMMKFLLCFSFYSNAKTILNTNTKPGQIYCVHGIRLFSMCWVMLGHSYQAVFTADNLLVPLTTLPKQLFTLTISNATYSVDSFFVLSGMLLSYLWFKEMRAHPARLRAAYTWVMYYVHRYIRLTPVYAIVLASYIYLTPYMTDRKMEQVPDYKDCINNWWSNFLYINNVYRPTRICYGVTWYLANDMQFYVLAPVLLIALFYKPLYAIIGWGVVTAAALAGNVYTTYYYHLSPGVLGEKPDPYYQNMSKEGYYSGETWNDAHESISNDMMYVAPWIRYITYDIGIFLGYIFACKRTIRINKILNLCMWGASLVIGLTLVYGLYNDAQGVYIMPLGLRMLYNAVTRPIWALCLGWLIFSCHYGYAGWINQFLSWKGWIPLSRLTYCAYLLHVMIMYIIILNRGQSLHWNGHFNWMSELTVPLIFCSYVAAFIVSCSFEIPILSLERLVLPRKGAGPANKVYAQTSNGDLEQKEN